MLALTVFLRFYSKHGYLPSFHYDGSDKLISEESINYVESGMECPICYESLLSPPNAAGCVDNGERRPESAAESLCTTKCGHVYHQTCILEWVRENPSCPTCRKRVDPASLLEVFLRGKGKEPCKKCPKYKGLYLKSQKKVEALKADVAIEKQINEMNSDQIRALQKERDEMQLKLQELKAQMSTLVVNTNNVSNTGSSTSQSGNSNSILNRGFLAVDTSQNMERPSSRAQAGTETSSGTSRLQTQIRQSPRASSSKASKTRSPSKISASKKRDPKPELSLSPIEVNNVDKNSIVSSLVVPRRKSLPKTPQPPTRRSERITSIATTTTTRDPRRSRQRSQVRYGGAS